MPGLERTFEALVLRWDGVAVRDHRSSARALRKRVDALCAHGVDVAVVSHRGLDSVSSQLGAGPAGPGRLLLAANRGSELFVLAADGAQLISRRQATGTEQAALDRAVALLQDRLTARGLVTPLPVAALNRRSIDLTSWLRDTEEPDLRSVVELAGTAAKEVGLPDARITLDVDRLEVGLTAEVDSMRALLAELDKRGIGPGLTLVVGDRFAPSAGVPSVDSFLLLDEASRLTAASVGSEPDGVPVGVHHLPGGPPAVRALLDEQLRRRTRRRVPEIDEDPDWVLALDADDPRKVRVHESLLSLGDGRIGQRGSHDPPHPLESPLLVAAGVYTGAGATQHLLEGPAPPPLRLTTSADCERRALDLRTGVLVREGADRVRTMRFVSAAQPGVVAVRAEGPAGLVERSPLRRHPAAGATASGPGDGGNRLWARAVGDRGGIGIVVSQRTGRDQDRRTVERLMVITADPLRPPPISSADHVLRGLEAAGFDDVLSQHRSTWVRRWNDACVWIPDDPAAQLALRFALFQLWNNVAAAGEAAVGARGLTGPGYAGHVFWDSDVFVLPAMASICPPAALAMLEYRLHRLPQARSAAALREWSGARFPWESAADGDDVTPTSGRVNGAWVPILTGQQEEHITADVAWAASHYADWTGHPGYLEGPHGALVLEPARYWDSRVETDTSGRGHLRHVIGPDEYHEDVDDNAYTNLMARWNLRRAASLTHDSEQARQWRATADSLVDGYDADTGRHEQFHGYAALEPLVVADIGTPPLAADLLLGAARVSASQIIKQPDVLMAHHLIPTAMPAGSLAADLELYLPRTAHGSSLSPAITASLLARAGRPDEALEHLDVALRLDLDDLTGMTSAGLHMATLAGVWQAVLFGFAGVRVEDGCLSLDPRLPTRWSSLRLRFLCLRRHVDLRINTDTALITVSGPLMVRTLDAPPAQITGQRQLIRTDEGWTVQP